MNFNSLQFLVFYPIVVLLNFLVPTKYRFIPLLAASLYFYMSWNAELLYLILFTTAVSYAAGILIEKKPRFKKLWLVIALLASLSVLFFFKYYNFLSGTISAIVAPEADWSLKLILPVGISFYTFQTLSYAIDVYRGSIPAEHNFFYYALFVTFFPQLVAGPIERPENLLPQLKEEHRWNNENALLGGKRMLAGFFKKIVVADLCAEYVDKIFNTPEESTGLMVAVGAVLFAIQIYCDFSGYTDIAIGCARVMGIKLMQNFDRPYFADSIHEFWRRWHISLTSWFTDYLYIPLGGSRRGTARTVFNTLLVFFVSGMWHGADWTFILWGLVHGVYQVVGRLTRKGRDGLYEKLKLDKNQPVIHFLRQVVTFILVCFAWIFFRANNIRDLGVLLGKLFTAPGGFSSLSALGFTPVRLAILALSVILLALLDKRITCPEAQTGDGGALRGTTALALVWSIVFAWLILLAGDGSSSFIYFQF